MYGAGQGIVDRVEAARDREGECTLARQGGFRCLLYEPKKDEHDRAQRFQPNGNNLSVAGLIHEAIQCNLGSCDRCA